MAADDGRLLERERRATFERPLPDEHPSFDDLPGEEDDDGDPHPTRGVAGP